LLENSAALLAILLSALFVVIPSCESCIWFASVADFVTVSLHHIWRSTMKRLISTFNILLLAALTSSFAFAEDKPAEEWLFVHTAEEAQVINTTTIVIPVTRDVFAFTDRPYRKHGYMTGEKFASLWAKAGNNGFKTDPPNAVLTWVEGKDVKEAELVITGASFDGNSITYTTNSHRNTVGTIKSVSVFVDPGVMQVVSQGPQDG
jgi:hypothetical protein